MNPAQVTVTLPWDEAQALADHPAKLQPDDPGLYWVGKVKRACQRLTEAMQAAQGAHLEARGERLPDWPTAGEPPKPADAPTAVEDPGRRSSGPEIPPAGALEPGDDVTVLPDEELPEALRLARRARVAPDPMAVATPSQLWKLAERDGGRDRAELYNHAMIEAGFIVEKIGGQPYDPCPTCNWSPTK